MLALQSACALLVMYLPAHPQAPFGDCNERPEHGQMKTLPEGWGCWAAWPGCCMGLWPGWAEVGRAAAAGPACGLGPGGAGAAADACPFTGGAD